MFRNYNQSEYSASTNNFARSNLGTFVDEPIFSVSEDDETMSGSMDKMDKKQVQSRKKGGKAI